MEEMTDRIVKLMKVEGLTNSKFASILGIQRSNITHILDGRNKPSLSFIEKLIAKFPHINIEWLITGTGEMYKQTENHEQKFRQKTGDSPTLFPEINTIQNTAGQKENQTASQNIKHEIKDVTTNILSKHEPELILEMDNQTAKISEKKMFPPQNPENVQNSKQLTPFEPDTTEKNKERKIECVLIFHSDKTFKYYKPE
jgi:transcriptional regulator with XRE-family HTH domain